jgi:hypothetical protein
MRPWVTRAPVALMARSAADAPTAESVAPGSAVVVRADPAPTGRPPEVRWREARITAADAAVSAVAEAFRRDSLVTERIVVFSR